MDGRGTSSRLCPSARGSSARRRRGSVILVVIWALAIAAVATAAVQIVAYRHAVMGKEALGRVQARWAARAGVEETISVMAYHAENPDTRDAFRLVRDMENVSAGRLSTGSWDIRHFRDGQAWAGPMDEHSKLNVNVVSTATLLQLPNMTADVADSIADWRDEDDEVSGMGAESSYYLNLGFPYKPRNRPIRSIAELELIAGGRPQYVRGEDWNLNGRLDPNEDDGRDTWPPDDGDGILDAGWSQYLTAYSTTSPLSISGQPRLNLKSADVEEIVSRLGVDQDQAAALQTFAKTNNAQLPMLLTQDLSTIGAAAGGGSGGNRGAAGQRGQAGGRNMRGLQGQAQEQGGRTVRNLDTEQLRRVFQECTLEDEERPGPGKLNLNTAPADLLREVLSFDSRTADAIIRLRETREEGITSVVDLLEIPDIAPATLQALAALADTVSNVYSITSRGRSAVTGAETEIFVLVDRSTLPIRILEYREQ